MSVIELAKAGVMRAIDQLTDAQGGEQQAVTAIEGARSFVLGAVQGSGQVDVSEILGQIAQAEQHITDGRNMVGVVTDPDRIDAIRARLAYAALPWWQRLTRRSPAGWARKGER